MSDDRDGRRADQVGRGAAAGAGAGPTDDGPLAGIEERLGGSERIGRPEPVTSAASTGAGTPSEVLRASLALGLTSFGGPVAHIGYFRREYVERRGWLDESAFADLVALCQLLPGPASSQLGIAIGTRRAGLPGGLAAWLGFTLPSAIVLLAFAILLGGVDVASAGWVHGLKLAAVAVVAQALWAMARSLTPDAPRLAIAAIVAVIALIWTSSLTQVVLIAVGALVGRLLLPAGSAAGMAGRSWRAVTRRTGGLLLGAFVILLGAAPVLAAAGGLTALFAAFYQSGALVFGGGHVVLPLLHSAVVDPGWVPDGVFLAGYGAAQAVPGPLFTIAAFLGATALLPSPGIALGLGGVAVAGTASGGIVGGGVALVAIFLPGALLILGTLPFWDGLRRSPGFRRALAGTNAVVVGLLAAAFWNPILTGSIRGAADVAIAAGGVALLASRRVPPIAVVGLAALAGQLLGPA